MLDFTHLHNPQNGVYFYVGNQLTADTDWVTWVKPRGKSMCSITICGKGGDGGTSTPAAATAIAGSGGGSSGTLTTINVPMSAIPDRLYLWLPGLGFAAGSVAKVTVSPETITGALNVLVAGKGGNNGGNATSATGGSAGTSVTAAAVTDMPLGWQWANTPVAGMAGTAGGGSQTAGSNLTLATTNFQIVTGGTGGGGIDSATGTAGYAGGNITAAGALLALPGGAAGSATTTPPGAGSNGIQPIPGMLYFYGGTGSGSQYNLATGAGLVQLPGGNGAPGCGGGGVGAGLSGVTAAAAGKGGPAFCMITCW